MYNMAYINIKQIQLKDESLGEINEIKSWSFFIIHSFIFHLQLLSHAVSKLAWL